MLNLSIRDEPVINVSDRLGKAKHAGLQTRLDGLSLLSKSRRRHQGIP
jgi:hypothetical protein